MRKSSCLLLALPLIAACGKQPAPPEPLRPVKTLRIAPETSGELLALPGEVHARYEAPLSFRVGGKVIECKANQGDAVHGGQVLARLEPEDYQLAAKGGAANEAQARSSLVLAEAELKRYTALREKGFISAAALDQKQASYDAARASLEAMQSNRSTQDRRLGYTALTADGDGVITSLNCNPGQVVNAGQQVMGFARNGAKEVSVSVPEASLDAFRNAANFRIRLNALPDKSWQGSLRELSAGADPATRTFAARIAVKDADAAMQLGMSATIELVSNGEQAMRLPLSAVVSRDSKPTVWKVDNAGVVHAAPIAIAGIEGNGVRVASGVGNGDVVVTAGVNLLRDGEKVKLAP